MKALNFIFFIIFLVIGEIIAVFIGAIVPPLGVVAGIFAFFFALFLASMIKLAYQWERAVVLRLGKYSATKGPGLFIIIPVIDQAIFVDTRTLTVDIPKQQAITKDNVPVTVDGVIYFKVERPELAIVVIQNYLRAMSEYALATLRDIIGEFSLDSLLSERELIGHKIEEAVEKEASKWGLQVSNIKIQDIDMPEELKKMMSRQASAEREKRATITKAEGDRDAAVNLAHAAKTMLESPGAMQLRTLQTLDGLGPTASNTVVMTVPIEIMQLVNRLKETA